MTTSAARCPAAPGDPPVELMAAVLDLIPAAVGFWNAELVNAFANRAVTSWYRLEPAEVHGRSLPEVLGPVAERVAPFVSAALRGEGQLLEEHVPVADGRTRVAHVTYVPNVVDGEVQGFVVFAVDITDRAEAQEALRRNTAQAALFGLHREVEEQVHPAARATADAAGALRAVLRDLADTPDTTERIVAARARADDAIAALRTTVTALRSPSTARPHAGTGPARPLTGADPARTPAGIRTSTGAVDPRQWRADDLVALLDLVPAALAVIGPDHTVRWANRAAEALLGAAAGGPSARTVSDLLGAEALAASEDYVRTALTGTPARFERTVIDPGGGTRYTQTVYAPIAGADGVAGVVVMVHELTSAYAGDVALLEHIEAEVLALERERIAEDLHDVVIQRLFAGALAAEFARAGTESRTRWLRTACATLDDALAELHECVRGRPADHCADGDLATAVARTVRSVVGAHDGHPSVTYIGSPASVPADVRADLLAVLSEALSNAVRHGRAAAIAVTVSTVDAHLTLTVADDGVGLHGHDAPSGLANMAARARRLGGSFAARPGVPGGTVVEWRVPLGSIHR